jgi:hypothetical protein
VVWSQGNPSEVWICDWDGKNKHKVLDGALGVGVAEDPPGTEWVYVNESRELTHDLPSVVRCQIDNPTKKEPVWDKTRSNDKWEFTRDGKVGASGLPWPHAGVANLPNGTFKNFGDGCTPGVANDLSCVFHMIGAGHRGIVVYDMSGGSPRQILYAKTLGLEGTPDPQFWWTSFARYDSRFFTFSGPHPSMRPTNGDIYFCQFTPNHDGVAKWVRVCETPELDTQPYAWIETPGAKKKPVAKTSPAAKGKAKDSF